MATDGSASSSHTAAKATVVWELYGRTNCYDGHGGKNVDLEKDNSEERIMSVEEAKAECEREGYAGFTYERDKRRMWRLKEIWDSQEFARGGGHKMFDVYRCSQASLLGTAQLKMLARGKIPDPKEFKNNLRELLANHGRRTITMKKGDVGDPRDRKLPRDITGESGWVVEWCVNATMKLDLEEKDLPDGFPQLTPAEKNFPEGRPLCSATLERKCTMWMRYSQFIALQKLLPQSLTSSLAIKLEAHPSWFEGKKSDIRKDKLSSWLCNVLDMQSRKRWKAAPANAQKEKVGIDDLDNDVMIAADDLLWEWFRNDKLERLSHKPYCQQGEEILNWKIKEDGQSSSS